MAALLPIVAVVFVAFLVTGLALPALPDPGIIHLGKIDSGVEVFDVPGATKVTFELIK